LDWFAGLAPKPRGRAGRGTGSVSSATVVRTAPRPADTRPGAATDRVDVTPSGLLASDRPADHHGPGVDRNPVSPASTRV
jgi:hypothetical protein